MKNYFYYIIISILLFNPSMLNAQIFNTLWDWLKSYKVGISKHYLLDQINLAYETTNSKASTAQECKQFDGNQAYYKCEHFISANSHYGYGIFLQPAFRKKGLFYYNADISIGFRHYKGQLLDEEIKENLPLQQLKFIFYGLNLQTYLQLGITPEKWPELIISFGPTAQWVWGNLTLNNKQINTGFLGMLNWSGLNNYTAFFKIELVLFRFGDGAFSLFTTNLSGKNKMVFGEIPQNIGEDMNNIEINFNRNSAGIKFLLDWP